MNFNTEHVEQHPQLRWNERPRFLPNSDPTDDISELKPALRFGSSSLSDGFIYLYNYSTRRYVWVSDSFPSATGFPCEKLLQRGTSLSLYSKRTERLFRRHILPEYQKILGTLTGTERIGLQVSFLGELVCQDGTTRPFVANLEVLQTDTKGRVHLDFGSIHLLNQPVPELKFAYRLPKSTTEQIHVITESMIPIHAEPRLDDLSPREHQILDLLLAGKSSRNIAEELFISSHTVDTHRRKILRKTGFDNTTDLINHLRGF